MPPLDSHPVPDDRIAVGVIRKPHGVRGELSVEPWTPDLERFADLRAVWLVAPEDASIRPAEIENVRYHGERVLVKFKGLDSPEEAAHLREWTIEIPADEARELDEDEYFLHDLIGLTVVRETSGGVVGTVTNTLEAGAGPLLLEVTRQDGGKFDLPFVTAICTGVDLDARTLTADLPEGLLDLDGIEKPEPGIQNSEFRIQKTHSQDLLPEPRTQNPEPGGESTQNSELRTQNSVFRVDIVTIFPRMFDAFLAEGIIARGVKAGLLEIRVHDLRDHSTDKHRSTDDEAYGGGAGMVMLAEPVFRCLDAIRESDPENTPHVVMLSPQGRPFNQAVATDFSGRKWLVLLCGRYEGFDERIREALVDEEVSVGDFVVSGGEVPAMLVADAACRMVEGVVGDRNSVEQDSFYHGLLDHPHYTRPAELRGMKVPEILLSGHAEKIRQWRKEQSLRATRAKRPDLLETAELDDEAKKMLRKIETE